LKNEAVNSICDLGVDNSKNKSAASGLAVLASHTEIHRGIHTWRCTSLCFVSIWTTARPLL